MTKKAFLEALEQRLSGLSKKDVFDHIGFYSEMIDDRIEDGLSEEDAVNDIGSVEHIAEQIISEVPLVSIIAHKIKPKRRLGAISITLLILGSPIWASLLIAAIAVVFSLYASLWSIIISLWASFGAIVGSAFGALVFSGVLVFTKNALTAIAFTGVSLLLAGLSIFVFYGCKYVTRGMVLLTKKSFIGIKRLFLNNEGGIEIK